MKCMWPCVGYTAFVYVCVRLWTMYVTLRRLYGFCALSGLCIRIRLCLSCTAFARYADCAYIYGFCALSGLCVRIRLLRFKRLVRTYTTFTSWAACVYRYAFLIPSTSCWFDLEYLSFRLTYRWSDLEVCWFVWRLCDQSWWTARRIRPEDVIFRILSPTICTFWLDRLAIPYSGFRWDIYPTLFTWFTVQFLPWNVYYWAIL